jgi:hypothetical protein
METKELQAQRKAIGEAKNSPLIKRLKRQLTKPIRRP